MINKYLLELYYDLKTLLPYFTTFVPHFQNTVKTKCFHLRNIGSLRPTLSFMLAEKLINIFVFSSIDNCHLLLVSVSKAAPNKVQLVRNPDARGSHYSLSDFVSILTFSCLLTRLCMVWLCIISLSF